MKFIVKLSYQLTKELSDTGNMVGVCILPASESLKDVISEFMFDNTGFQTKSVIGISKIFGEDSLDMVWDDLASFMPFKEGDFLLEFDMPNDTCATMAYSDFLTFSSKSELLPEEVINKLSMDGHTDDDNEVLFCPFIDLKYLTGFSLVSRDWEQNKQNINKTTEITLSSYFEKTIGGN